MDISVERAYPTPLANSTLLPMLLLSLATQKPAPKASDEIDTEYDYIVVGGGTAGSVIASRLSEMPCLKVLLLEAGDRPPLLTEVPAFSEYFLGTDFDWNFKTVPQKHVGDGLINRQLIYHSGKSLGGSSILNNMMYVRGNKKDYDRWAEEGAKGWSYEDVFPYFKKMEDNRDENYIINGFHGEDGPVSVHQPRYRSEWVDPLFKTIKSMGYKVVDPNGARQTGFYDVQSTLRSGQRCSTAKAYLVPAENRTNLDILPRAMVRKVLINDNQAIGVQFDYENETYEVKARREVILSAGTIKTAQLLKLSGIGPRKELERFHIPVIADLPVGFNLQDHPVSFTNFLLDRDVPQMAKKLEDPNNVLQYIHNRTGPLTSTGITAAAFLKNNIINPKKDFPNSQLTFAESQTEQPVHVGLTRKFLSQVYKPYKGRSFYTCYCSLLHPKSRGTVTLQSNDPHDSPLIDPNYLNDPKDVQELVEGIKTCLRIGKSPIMRRVRSIPFQTLIPGCEKYAENEKGYLECAVKSAIITFSHGVGTARMGDPKDPRTVVDPNLKVLHVKGLRVVDASIMPTIPSGGPYIPSIMIAEKASDIIKSAIECLEKEENLTEERTNPHRSGEIFDNSEQVYSMQRNSTRESRRKEPSFTRSLEAPNNPTFSESRREKLNSVQSPEARYSPSSSNAELQNIHSKQNHNYGNRLHDQKLHKVTPWNKEIPNVTPWNQELVRSNGLAGEIISNNQNPSLTGIQQNLPLASGNNFLMSQLTNLFNINRQQSQGTSNILLPQTQGIANFAQLQTGEVANQQQPQMQITDNVQLPTATNSGSSQLTQNFSPVNLPAVLPQQQSPVNLPPVLSQQQSPANLPQQQTLASPPQQQTPSNLLQQQLLSVPQLQTLVNSPQMQTFLSNPQLLSLFNNPQQQRSGNTLLAQPLTSILQNNIPSGGQILYSAAPPLRITANQPLSTSHTFHTGKSKSQTLDYIQENKQKKDKPFPWQNVGNHGHTHVVPWNKEIPNVTPWNQEILQSQPFISNQQMSQTTSPGISNQIIPGIPNTGQGTSANQGAVNTQQPQISMIFGQNQTPQAPSSQLQANLPQTINPQNLISNQQMSQTTRPGISNQIMSGTPNIGQGTPTNQGNENTQQPQISMIFGQNQTPQAQSPQTQANLSQTTNSQTFISNQQMSQTSRPGISNQMMSGTPNIGQGMPTNQEGNENTQQPQLSMIFGQNQTPQTPSSQPQANLLQTINSQTGNGQQIPANLAENLRQLQQNLETQIPLIAGRQQFMQNLLDTVRQMLNLLSSDPSMLSSRSGMNFESLNRNELCSFLLENMHCNGTSCLNRTVVSTYMHSQLCA